MIVMTIVLFVVTGLGGLIAPDANRSSQPSRADDGDVIYVSTAGGGAW